MQCVKDPIEEQRLLKNKERSIDLKTKINDRITQCKAFLEEYKNKETWEDTLYLFEKYEIADTDDIEQRYYTVEVVEYVINELEKLSRNCN